MFWNDVAIRKWAEEGGITPYDQSSVNPASIDLKLGLSYRRAVVDTKQCEIRKTMGRSYKWSQEIMMGDEGLEIAPGELVLCSSFEFTVIPHFAVAFLFLKSTVGRLGIEHLHAGYGDPGFQGQWTFELINHWQDTVTLYPKMKICQLVFGDCIIPEKAYDKIGHYHAQLGATVPRCAPDGLR